MKVRGILLDLCLLGKEWKGNKVLLTNCLGRIPLGRIMLLEVLKREHQRGLGVSQHCCSLGKIRNYNFQKGAKECLEETQKRRRRHIINY
jgi:hypothetical protein